MTFDEQVRQLAQRRQSLAENEAQLAALRQAFEAEHEGLIATIKTQRETVDASDKALRDVALQEYELNGNKKPHPAVGIRVTKKSEFDATAALEYAKQKRPDWIVLDSKAYAKALTESGRDPEMPGEVVEVPTATVSKDLSDYVDRPSE